MLFPSWGIIKILDDFLRVLECLDYIPLHEAYSLEYIVDLSPVLPSTFGSME